MSNYLLLYPFLYSYLRCKQCDAYDANKVVRALGQLIDIDAVKSAGKYWLEQFPQTAVLSNLAVNARIPIMPTLRGWNTGGSPDIYVELTSLGITPIPNVLIQIVADGQLVQYRSTDFPPSLLQREVGMGAVSNLAMYILNQSGGVVPTLQINSTFTIWRMPTSDKILHGYSITQSELAATKRVREQTNPTLQSGTRPLDIADIIKGSYRNRRISPSINNFDQYLATPTSGGQAFYIAQAYSNQLIVITSISSDAFFDDGVTIQCDRDDDQQHLMLRADAMDLENGFSMFVPALRTLTFKIQSVSAAPDAPIPVRVEGWRISLSNILRLRLGLVDAAGLRSVYGDQAQNFSDRVLVGMN